ncbi:MAG: hypothetical protein VX910_05680 [Candidatus Latescibacterota bacterium]|nr:hypothetical protein [Candidatus Latescibacterota bacterium]
MFNWEGILPDKEQVNAVMGVKLAFEVDEATLPWWRLHPVEV